MSHQVKVSNAVTVFAVAALAAVQVSMGAGAVSAQTFKAKPGFSQTTKTSKTATRFFGARGDGGVQPFTYEHCERVGDQWECETWDCPSGGLPISQNFSCRLKEKTACDAVESDCP